MPPGPHKQFDPEVALARAMEVFWAHGYEATSLAALLERMGIGRKSLYDTYGNKQSLFLQALRHYADTTLRGIHRRLEAPGSPLANLKQLLADFERINGQPGSPGCMLGTNIADFSTGDTLVAETLRGYVRQLEDAFTATLQRAQAAGELGSSAHPRQLASLLLCATQGIALLGRVMDDDSTLKGASQSLIRLLENS